MGRFETTAKTYARHREPYPPAFFAAVAEALKLEGREALIDLGTGPGVLALGFAPYVGRILGVDSEPAMVAEARRSAAEAEIAFPVIEGRAEDLAADLGPFDLITVGRALHWMDRSATLSAFDRLLAPAGRVLICGSTTVPDADPWRAAFDAVMRSWGDGREGKHRRLVEHWFDGSRFMQVAEIKIAHAQPITAEDLVERALTRSTSSRAVLGPRVDAFRAELLGALAPFFPGSTGQEVVEAKAVVFAAS
jgi:cyclopropane fatty-acyl-phospholipid synthase-like methyltransferase